MKQRIRRSEVLELRQPMLMGGKKPVTTVIVIDPDLQERDCSIYFVVPQHRKTNCPCWMIQASDLKKRPAVHYFS